MRTKTAKPRAPQKQKTTAKTPAKRTAAAPKRAAATVKSPKGFASLVRSVMTEALPSYRFLETSGGSGPVVTFERPTKLPRLRERIAFQKGLHGSDWFRVNLYALFVGDGAGGREHEHAILEGATLGPDVSWKGDAELEAALRRAATTLDREAAKRFGPHEKAHAKYTKLFGGLVKHYADWLDQTGRDLPPSDFIDDERGKLPAFSSWVKSLEKKKLTSGLPADLETALWRFWFGGRPMRREDYRNDDYYDCTQCKAFVSFRRGKLVAEEDPVVGESFRFVCKKH